MRRSTIFLSAAAVLVLGAGLVVGRLSADLSVAAKPVSSATTRPTEGGHGRGWFPDQLGLTPDQDQKMKAIWADVQAQMDKNRDHQHALEHDRDVAIHALLSPQQSAAYDKIQQDYHANRNALNTEREQFIKSGKDRTRAILTPDQQVKLDAMDKDMHDHHGPGGPPGGHGRGGPSSRPDVMNAATGPV
jgi:Spy/CpxP family protein refolding chaperone